MNLAGFLYAPEIALHEFLQAWMRTSLLLHKGDPITESEAILEEERRS